MIVVNFWLVVNFAVESATFIELVLLSLVWIPQNSTSTPKISTLLKLRRSVSVTVIGSVVLPLGAVKHPLRLKPLLFVTWISEIFADGSVVFSVGGCVLVAQQSALSLFLIQQMAWTSAVHSSSRPLVSCANKSATLCIDHDTAIGRATGEHTGEHMVHFGESRANTHSAFFKRLPSMCTKFWPKSSFCMFA